MSLPPLRVVLDANVLYPFSLRDTLLRAAAAGYYQIYWSPQILEETSRNLVNSAGISQEQATHLMRAMTKAFPEAMVSGHEVLVEIMPDHEKDRHVTAAAVVAAARIIVTNNLKDFQILPAGIEAQSPDKFLVDLFALEPDSIIGILQQQAAALQRPAITVEDLLVGLAKTVPTFVQVVRLYNPHK